MQRLLAAVAVVVAFLAGRETASEVQAKPVVTVQRDVVTVTAPAVHCAVALEAVASEDDEPDVDDDPDAIDIADTPAMRQLDAQAKLRVAVAQNPNPRGAIFGTTVDAQTGERLAGVTVVATARGTTQVAISDENGYYQITDLEPDAYLVTFYYLETTLEHAGVTVSARESTPVYTKILQRFDAEPAITIDTEYVKNIEVPGRTFESALGVATGSHTGDGEGVSFTGTTSVANTYIVED